MKKFPNPSILSTVLFLSLQGLGTADNGDEGKGQWVEESIDDETGLRTGTFVISNNSPDEPEGDLVSHQIEPNANLEGVIMVEASLQMANLKEANLKEAILVEANFEGANLEGVDLTRADLSGANLNGANLAGAVLIDANLEGADLAEANIDAANFSGANLNDVNSSSISGTPQSLPDGWILVDGELDQSDDNGDDPNDDPDGGGGDPNGDPNGGTAENSTITDDPSIVWQKAGGPIGGLGYNVRYCQDNKSIMFVTDGWAGIQKSVDGGLNWEASNNGITARSRPSGDAIPVFALKIDPNDPTSIWAGTLNGFGLFHSTDRGETYVERSNGLPTTTDEITIRHIEVMPGDSSKVFVMGEKDTGVWGEGFSRVRGFVYASTDGGLNWSPLGGSNFPFPSLTRWLWIDPTDTDTMVVMTGIFDRESDVNDPNYASGPGVGVYRTTDGGTTWTPSNAGMDTNKSLFVGGFDKSPINSQTFIVATGNNTDWLIKNVGGAVYRTTDGGVNWTDVSPDPPFPGEFDTFTAVAYAPSDASIVYVASAEAVYRSINGGSTWARYAGAFGAPYGPEGIRSGVPIDMVVDPDDPDVLYINNYGGGVFKSTDGGQTWIVWSTGYTGADINQVTVKPGDPDTVLVNGRSGAFYSEDSGVTWDGQANGLGAIPEGMAAVFDPSDATGNTRLISDERQGFILRSTDGGLSWTKVLDIAAVNEGNPHGARRIVFAPGDASVVYAGFAASNLFSDPHEMGFASSFGVWKSVDGGVTWSDANGNLPSPASGRNVTSIAISYQNDDIVYVGLREGGIYKTVNGGTTWTHITNQVENNWGDVWPSGDPLRRDSFLSLSISPDNDDVVYAGTNIRGLYKTTDGGATWIQIVPESELIPFASEDHVHIFDVKVNPTDSTEVYMGEWHSGMYRSTDSGTTWKRINSGLSTRAVQTVDFSDDGQTVYVGTKGEGVFLKASSVSLTISSVTNGSITAESTYQTNSTATIIATPSPGYAFYAWSGDASGSENPLSLIMDSNKTIGATFTEDTPEGRLGGWATGYGVASETDPEDDPDKDGLTNLEEYLTESDPSDFHVRRSPLVVETPVAGTRQFTLIETLDLVGREINTTLQQSTDLITWTTVTGTTEDSNDSDPVLGVRTRVLSLTPVSNDEVYYRLKVEL